MKRFWEDTKKYFNYTKYSAKADLKAEVADSYLNWLWWILDPLLFMLVYTFIALLIFRRGVKYFPVFVFIALTLWNFFNKTVMACVRVIRQNSGIVSKVYLPKHILVIQKMMVNGFKMLVSFALVVIMIFIYRVPLTWNVFYIIPVMIELSLFTFGIGCFVLHFGVFINDLNNVMTVVLRLMFYMSGIFYSISDRLHKPLSTILLTCNPMSMLIESARLCLLYEGVPHRKALIFWGILSVFICAAGVKLIYRYENSYVKVI